MIALARFKLTKVLICCDINGIDSVSYQRKTNEQSKFSSFHSKIKTIKQISMAWSLISISFFFFFLVDVQFSSMILKIFFHDLSSVHRCPLMQRFTNCLLLNFVFSWDDSRDFVAKKHLKHSNKNEMEFLLRTLKKTMSIKMCNAIANWVPEGKRYEIITKLCMYESANAVVCN